jgi:hypothetical protein
LAFITDPRVVRKILDHLHLPSTDLPRAPARLSQKHVEMFADRPAQELGDETLAPPPRASRDPP